MTKVNIQRHLVHVNGIDLFYLDTHSEGDVIILLHGRWGRAETWVNLMLHYGDRYRIIAPDQRGHGLSSKPIGKYTGPEMAEDIVALMDELNLHSVILVGHSMGGHIAGCLTAAHLERVRALALLDKSAGGPEQLSSLPVDELPLVDPVTENWPLPFSSLNEARAFLRQANESDLSYTYFMNSLVEEVDGVRMMFSPPGHGCQHCLLSAVVRPAAVHPLPGADRPS